MADLSNGRINLTKYFSSKQRPMHKLKQLQILLSTNSLNLSDPIQSEINVLEKQRDEIQKKIWDLQSQQRKNKDMIEKELIPLLTTASFWTW